LTRGGGIGEFLMLVDLASDIDERKRLFMNEESFMFVDDTVAGNVEVTGLSIWLKCKCMELDVRIGGLFASKAFGCVFKVSFLQILKCQNIWMRTEGRISTTYLDLLDTAAEASDKGRFRWRLGKYLWHKWCIWFCT
jgi:hypothetical protein